jgi:hypothetical protein
MFRTIYRNRRQAIKVRAVLWGTAMLALVAVALGAGLLANSEPGDAAVVVLLLSWPFPGMYAYASIYVLEIRIAKDFVEIDVPTLTARKTRRIPAGNFRVSDVRRGRMISSRGQYIDTPWVNLSVQGRKWPYLVDLQAEEIDQTALAMLGKR